MHKEINVVVVGLGHWGPNLVRSIEAHPQARVVAAVEPSIERIKVVQEKLPNLKIYQSFEECLAKENSDAVVIAVPTVYHHQIAMQALAAGKHLLIEKPIAHTSAAALEIIELARQKNLIVMTGHIFLFNQAVVEMKNIVGRKELGRVLYARAIRTNLGPIRSDVNSLWDLASHDISVFNYLFDALPIQVSCTAFSPLGLKPEDIAQASLIYPDNRIAIIFVSWLDPQKRREVTVVGENKMLVFDDMNPQKPLKIYDKGVKLNSSAEYVDSFQTFRLSIREGNLVEPQVTTGEPLKLECSYFIDCVLQGQQPFTDGQNGLEVVRVLEALARSMNRGGAPEYLWESKPGDLRVVAGGIS